MSLPTRLSFGRHSHDAHLTLQDLICSTGGELGRFEAGGLDHSVQELFTSMAIDGAIDGTDVSLTLTISSF